MRIIGTDVTDFKKLYRAETIEKLPDTITKIFQKIEDLKYGLNPGVPAAIFEEANNKFTNYYKMNMVKTGKGGSSGNNVGDIDSGVMVLKSFKGRRSIVAIKHDTPCGFSTQFNNNSTADICFNSVTVDIRSAYGSTVVGNVPMDMDTAKLFIGKLFFADVVAFTGYEDGVIGLLKGKRKNLRIYELSDIDKLPVYEGDDTGDHYIIRVLWNGQIIIEKPYLSNIIKPEDLIIDPMVVTDDQEKHTVQRDPTPQEKQDFIDGWKVVAYVKSNGVLFFKNGTTIAINSGEVERVGSIAQATTKGYQKAMDRKVKIANPDNPYTPDGMSWREMEDSLDENPFKDSILATDGYLPFDDSVHLIGQRDVSGIIQPGGSIRDAEVIDAVNKYDMSMAFTKRRCFRH